MTDEYKGLPKEGTIDVPPPSDPPAEDAGSDTADDGDEAEGGDEKQDQQTG